PHMTSTPRSSARSLFLCSEPSPTAIYPLSLHDALPIWPSGVREGGLRRAVRGLPASRLPAIRPPAREAAADAVGVAVTRAGVPDPPVPLVCGARAARLAPARQVERPGDQQRQDEHGPARECYASRGGHHPETAQPEAEGRDAHAGPSRDGMAHVVVVVTVKGHDPAP